MEFRALSAVFAAFAFALAVQVRASSPAPAGAGNWEGELIEQGQAVAIRYDLVLDAKGARGRFSADSWRVMDYPLDRVELKGDHVAFLMGDDRLDGTVVGDILKGTFKGGADGEGTFVLRRAASTVLPYREIPVTFRNGDAVLSGTLALPSTPGRHPAVVLVQGSGPEVRWGTNRYIADRFARAGIAALIYDKRGAGQSSGDWRQATYPDLARDALAGVALLAGRPDIDPERIGIHGHSEGGIVGPLAESLAPVQIAFLVVEDAPSERVRDQDLYRVTNDINAQDWPAADKKHALEIYTLFLDVIGGEKPYSAFEAASTPVKDQVWFQYLDLPPRDHWLWKWYPPRANFLTSSAWSSIKRPVLLVYGEHDQLVPVEQSLRRYEDILEANGAPYTAIIIPRAEHNLTIHPRPGEPFFWWRQAPGAIDIVVAWVRTCTSDGACHAR